MKKTRLFTFLIASIFALAISAQGIVVHQGNSKKVSFKSADVQKIEFTEDQVENSTDNYVEKSELEDLLGKLRDEINLKLDRTEADKIWKEIEIIIGLCNNMVDKSAHESLRNAMEDKKADRSDLDKALKKIDELSDLVKDLQSKIGAGGGSGDNTGGSVENNMNNGHEYVDLGLSVKWATMNVGASSPEGYGDYFALGETTTKSTYDWSTYKYCNGSYDTLTKYCTDNSYGIVDNKTVLDPEDDVAHVKWGGDWRMPTKADQEELRTKCTWTWVSKNGIKGYTTVGPNGNSLFLPAAGYRDDSSLSSAGSNGYYWASSSDSSDAYYLYFDSSGVGWGYDDRYRGHAVRPVCP